MGRRSINTTKSGKYMNPTDQARKEARKKELKKNKRQRQMVRAAVLKMKDPTQIIEELEKIDEMEYNVLQPSPLNEKVLKEKRKKLKETLDRVLKMYDKDEPERWTELKRQEADYERKRSTLAAYHESVRHAQAVQIDDIPLPSLQVPDNLIYGNMPSQIPLPMELTPSIVPMPPSKPINIQSILKKDTVYKEIPPALEPPGVPPGPPPSLDDMTDDEEAEQPPAKRNNQKTLRFSDQMEEEPKEPEIETEVSMDPAEYEDHPLDKDDRITDTDDRIGPPPAIMLPPPVMAVKPTYLQQRMLVLSGQNVDEFMKEMEEVHKKRELDRAADLDSRLSALKRRQDETNSDEEEHPTDKDERLNIPHLMCPPGTTGSDSQPSMVQRPLMPTMLRPPPLRPPGPPPPGMRMPQGLPPNRPAPPGPPPGLPPRLLRLPPGPPPGLPPRALVLPHTIPHPIAHTLPLPVLSAAPQLINRKDAPQQGATIMAKPQIRNLSADVTRFVPSALRVKREDKKGKPGAKGPTVDIKKLPDAMQKAPGAPTKDDAYMQFMQELKSLL